VTARPAFSPVVTLAPIHQLGGFTCGDPEIDAFLLHRAHAEQTARRSQVYVTANANHDVLGYFTLSPVTVRVETALLSKLGIGAVPYPQIGGYLLGRLGVQTTFQNRSVGRALVMRAAQIAKDEAEVVGGAFLAVDPKTESLVQWYTALDFVRLSEKTRRMVLPFTAIP
jgi:GNAT superfamily N-acetyltransferase